MPRSLGYLFLLTASFCVAQQSAVPAGAWIPAAVKWKPSTVRKRESWTQTTVLYFSAAQDFGIVHCSFSRNEKAMGIGYQNVQMIHFGKWSRTGSTILVKYRLLYRALPHLGDDPTLHHEKLALRHGEVAYRGRAFHREPRLDSAVVSTISEFNTMAPQRR